MELIAHGKPCAIIAVRSIPRSMRPSAALILALTHRASSDGESGHLRRSAKTHHFADTFVEVAVRPVASVTFSTTSIGILAEVMPPIARRHLHGDKE